jgi:hypothetical protein
MHGGNMQAGGYSGMQQPAYQPYPNQVPSSQFGQPQVIQQPQMAQPQTGQAQVVPITTNQMVDYPNKYKLSPVVTKCPHCYQQVTTNVETQCSCCACCVCCMTAFVVYACIQCCRGKDICCQDAVHRCPSCQKDIYYYKAMN